MEKKINSIYLWKKKKKKRDSALLLQGVQVWFLVWELRFQTPHDVAKKFKKEREKRRNKKKKKKTQNEKKQTNTAGKCPVDLSAEINETKSWDLQTSLDMLHLASAVAQWLLTEETHQLSQLREGVCWVFLTMGKEFC